MNLRNEEIDLEIKGEIATLSLNAQSNVRLVNESYNMVKKADSAEYLEWMIRGDESLKDLLFRLGLRADNLGKKFKEWLSADMPEIKGISQELSKDPPKRNKIFRVDEELPKHTKITVKWIKGGYGDHMFPAINIVIPLSECRHTRGENYIWKLSMDDLIKIGYKTLYWISVSDIFKRGKLDVAPSILGKID
jgi:hypothetical protein